VLFGFVIGENSFFPRTVLRILFSVFFPYIDTDSQCDDHNIRNRKRTENKHLSDDDHEQLQLSWRRLPPPCDPEGRRAGGSSFVGCPCRQRLSRAHVSPEWAEGGSWKLSTRPPSCCSDSRSLFSRWRAELRTGTGVAFRASGVARFAVLHTVSLAGGGGGDSLNSRNSPSTSCPSS